MWQWIQGLYYWLTATINTWSVSFPDFLLGLALRFCCFVAILWGIAFALECFNTIFKWHIAVNLLSRIKTRFTDRAQIGFLAIAAAAAVYALSYYRDQTAFNLLTALETRDRDTRAVYMDSGENGRPVISTPSLASVKQTKQITTRIPGDVTPTTLRPVVGQWSGKDMMRIFSGDPIVRAGDGSVREIQESEYVACSPATKQLIRTWAQNYFKEAARFDPGPWQTIPELWNLLWRSDKMLEQEPELARALTLHAIDYLYIVHDAMRAKQLRYFNEGEYMMWGAYLDDLTPSPFFMLAMADGMTYPYMMKEVRDEIRIYYSRKDKPMLNCIVKTMFPTFLRERA